MPNVIADKIGDVVDDFTGDKLSLLVEQVKIMAQVEQAPAFVMGYCAATNEIYDAVAEYLQKEMKIAGRLEVELSTRGNGGFRNYLQEHILELNGLPGEIVLVKARGFERLKDLEFAVRVGHDYDQEVMERKEKFKGLTKKVVAITHIGYSNGQKGYDRAVISAVRSQFRSFLWKIE